MVRSRRCCRRRLPAHRRRAYRRRSSPCCCGCARSEGEQRQQLRLIAVVGGPPGGRDRARCSWRRRSTAASRPCWPACRCSSAYFLHADPVRDRRPALPALRHRRDHQPGRRRGSRAPLFAGLGYIAARGASAAAVERRTGGFWLSLLATAVVALAFQPLRRGVRPAGEPAGLRRARAALRGAGGLQPRPRRGRPSPDALLPAVAEAAGPGGVGARGAVATLDAPGIEPVTAAWGPPTERRGS